MPTPPTETQDGKSKAITWLKWPLGVMLLAILGIGGATLGSGGTAAIAKALEDPLSLLADRSPGNRPDGALFATKRPKVKALDPTELVLGNERTRPAPEEPAPEGIVAPEGLVPVETPEFVAAGPVEPALAAVTPPVGGPVGPFIGGGGGGLVPIGDIPGSPGTPGTPGCCDTTPPTDPTDPVTPAVPEPATWVMLILGFFMVGASLRSRTRLGVAPQA